MTDGRTDGQTDRRTDGPTKRGVESRSTRLESEKKVAYYFSKKANHRCQDCDLSHFKFPYFLSLFQLISFGRYGGKLGLSFGEKRVIVPFLFHSGRVSSEDEKRVCSHGTR